MTNGSESYAAGFDAGYSQAAFVARYGPREPLRIPLWHTREPRLTEFKAGYESGLIAHIEEN